MSGDISENFYYKEFFVSEDHPDLAINEWEKEKNNEEFKQQFRSLAIQCLQPTRDYINKPIKINSGYRDQFLNIAVGGVSDSDHTLCMAADITADYDLFQLFKWMIDNICYRQVIYYPEQNFIHVSVNSDKKQYRHSALVKADGKYHQAMDYLRRKG